ncbi:alpha/beta fold hydrolase [Neptunicella marina]|uniref:Alpha/beta fold hydrolase n=1 Tax=Neptunicella marina TaxID=2125989 RepID=A0A8J6ITY0_9ALTE|nr:alpha/beta fold hydrolase [Neptunicella marina]MBC3766621.1 alpha/beta fold hydrolase [Neptunicella marina]
MQRVCLNDTKQIVAHFFAAENATATVIMAPAMGVEQSYYFPLAHWLVSQNINCLTFDYEGMGFSNPDKKPINKASLTSWAWDDATSALNWVRSTLPELPIIWFGHSFGGQLLPMLQGQEHLNKVVTFNAGNGYWKLNAPQLRKRSLLMWYLLVPLLTPLAGYFPGKSIGVVGDIPKYAIWQWRKWCLNPNYMLGAEGKWAQNLIENLQLDLTAIHCSDDEMLTEQSIHSLHTMFAAENWTLTRLIPEELGHKRIGHLGFFHKRFSDTLWPEVLLPLLTTN